MAGTRTTLGAKAASARRSRQADRSKPPPFQPVQLATLVDTVPTGDRWLHEMKYDGYRLLVAVGGGSARAYTRSGLDRSDRFAGMVAEAEKLNVGSALLDGEAVVMDDNGRSSFQGLQGALKSAPASIEFIAFDLLEHDGEDLTQLPLTERKARLHGIGTGFGNDEIMRLMETMGPLEQSAPTVNASRAEVRGAHWLKPKLVAEIAYTEMTNEGTLRHPSYLGLRADKKPEAVVLEGEQRVATVAAPAASRVKVSNPDRVMSAG